MTRSFRLLIILTVFVFITPMGTVEGAPCSGTGFSEGAEPMSDYQGQIVPADHFIVQTLGACSQIPQGYDYYRVCFDRLGHTLCSNVTPNSFYCDPYYNIYAGACRSSWGGMDDVLLSYVVTLQGSDCSVSIFPEQAKINGPITKNKAKEF